MAADVTSTFDSVRLLLRNTRQRDALQALENMDRGSLSPLDLGQYYYWRALAKLYLGKYDDSDVKKSMKILRCLRPRSAYLRAVLLLGMLNNRRGDWAEGRHIFSKVSRIASKLGDQENEAVASAQLGWNLAQTGEFSSAYRYFERSITLFENMGDHKRRRDAVHNQSHWCIQYGHIQEGLSGYLANPLSRDEIALGTATSYFVNIAKAYSILARGEEARDALSKCYPHFADDKRTLSVYKRNMGISYLGEGEFEIAVEYLDEALAIAQGIGCDLVCSCQRLLGECYLELCDLGRAKECALESLSLARDSGERLEIGASYRVLGSVAGLQGDTKTAVELLSESMTIFTDMGSQYELAKTQYFAGHTGLFDSRRQNELIALSTKYFELEGIPLPSRPSDLKIRLARALLDSGFGLKDSL